MKPLDILKKRVAETKDKKMRAELEVEQLKKQEARHYAEASELVGEPVETLADIERHRDEKKANVQSEMKTLAQELKSIDALSEQEISILEQEGYL